MSKKELYEKKYQAQLDEWNADIDKMKAKADKAESSVKLEYYKQVEDLRLKQHAAKAKLTELQNAGEDAWEDVKAGTEQVWKTLRTAVQQASDRFNK